MNNEFNLKEVLESKIGNFYFVSGRERDIDISVKQIDDRSGVRIIRGERGFDKKSLIQEFSAAFQFPYYANHDNWDGFDECICDLSWIPAKSYIIIITTFDKVLGDSPKDLHNLLWILKDAQVLWSKDNEFRKATPFNVIFHCEKGNEEICKSILEKEKIPVIIKKLKPFDSRL